MLDPDLRSMLVHTIYVAPVLSITPSGDPIHGTPAPFAARLEPLQTLVGTRPNGEDDVSEWQLFTEHPIGRKDMVWPHGADPRIMAQGVIPKRIEPLFDENGVLSHYEVLL
jgi:hypothetical protein